MTRIRLRNYEKIFLVVISMKRIIFLNTPKLLVKSINLFGLSRQDYPVLIITLSH